MDENEVESDLDPEDDAVAGRFPLSSEDVARVAQIVALIREHLGLMSPARIHVAAAVLLALERLPFTTPGVQATFGFMQPNMDGNYAWADIRIGEDEFRISLGEHFYTPAIGGDTESRIVFETQADTQWRKGDIDDWLEVASWITCGGEISCEDYSAHDEIDWVSS